MRPVPWRNRLKSLILACKGKAPATQIHGLMVTTGDTCNSISISRLIASYARFGDVVSARKVFDESPQRGVDAWNSMIIAYSRKNCPLEVLSVYRRMIAEGAKPDSSTFALALKACSCLMDLDAGEEIWRRAVGLGYEFDVFVGSAVLNLYAKCGEMDEAMLVFDKMVKRDVVCWTTVISGFVQSGRALEGVEMYRMMQREGIEGDWVVMVGLIQASADLGDLRMGLSVHGCLVRREIRTNDVVVQTSLVDMYAKNGHLELASRVFKEMSHKNVVSWGALVSGFAQNGFAGNALQLVAEMQNSGLKPNSVPLVGALLACSQVNYLKMGKSIHGYIVRSLDFEQVLATALIDMYAKCGALPYACALFDRIESRDLILWNAMIASYGIHGHGQEALSLFVKLRETNMKPDHATFASLLSALSHSGLVEEGKYWFNAMVNEYKIKPSEKHFACVVDLLSRAGQVEEAYQLIGSMNTEPELATWVALLSGCHSHGKSLIGEMAAEKILESNSNDLGIYALVSNFFSGAKKWGKVALLRRTMKETGMRKVPGYSAVEVNGKQQVFLMEDTNHSQNEDIMQMLKRLDHEMRARRSDNICLLHDPGEILTGNFLQELQVVCQSH